MVPRSEGQMPLRAGTTVPGEVPWAGDLRRP